MGVSPAPRSEVLETARAFVDQDDVDAVVAALRAGRLFGGDALQRFERRLVQVTGAPHAVAMSSGGAARHALYHALGVGPGRSVLAPAVAPPSAALAAQACGGPVEFVDVDAHTANLDAGRLEERLAGGSPPHVVSAVHFGGLPCDMEWLLALRRRHDFHLVEDATHALGARYRIGDQWYRVGEHPEVKAAVLSFHPDQTITTAAGGAVVTHDAELFERLRRLRAEGVDPAERDHPAPVELGFDYGLSELHAALGASQLEKLPDFLAARREIAMRYMAELRDYELLHPGGPDREHAFGLFCVRTAGEDRDRLLSFLRERGVRARAHPALPRLAWFRARGGSCHAPHAEAHAGRSLCLPIYPALSDGEQQHVIQALLDWRRARAAA